MFKLGAFYFHDICKGVLIIRIFIFVQFFTKFTGCPGLWSFAYMHMLCLSNSSYNFQVKSFLFYMIFVHILKVHIISGFLFSSILCRLSSRNKKCTSNKLLLELKPPMLKWSMGVCFNLFFLDTCRYSEIEADHF